MHTEIKFITTGWSAQFGAFSPGDVLRCSADAARHFVEEARCAVLVAPLAAPASAAVEDEAKPARRPRRGAVVEGA